MSLLLPPPASRLCLSLSRPTLRRTLFSSPFQTEPHSYREQKVLPFGQAQLYNVVSDVASYPRFVPFCTTSRITKPLAENQQGSGVHVMEAELTVGFPPLEESYVSRVTCIPYTSVMAEASSSTPLFKTLKTSWTFQPVTSQANADVENREQWGPTLVTLDLVYAFANPLHATMSGAFFGKVSKKMVRAFEDRCHQVYSQNK
ncbi:dehydrase and lipid transport-domain-containing protein [Amanita rubescens]|nr:dehydrase and lipid transport-domain-containing protein [Amanita rubescens]